MKRSYQKFLVVSSSTAVMASIVAPILPSNVLSAKAAGKEFSDLSSEKYYYDAVLSLSERGVIGGFNDGTYRPDKDLTRSEAASILAKALGLNSTNIKDIGFNDVPEGKWYYPAVAALVEKGIISGFDQKTFKPDKTVTRAELSKMLTLAFNLKASPAKTAFTDIPKNKWFASFVNTLVVNGVTDGITPTTFAPDQVVTRGQMAAFVYRAESTVLKNVSKESTVEKITDGTVTLSGTTYTLTDATKTIFNGTNEAVLKNAVVKFTSENGAIKSVIDLEIKTGGTANSAFVFDGKNGVIEGNVKVSADNVSVKNLTVKGDFVIGKEVTNSFAADKLTVSGKTTIAGETLVTAASDKFYQTLKAKGSMNAFKVATTFFANILLSNSYIGKLDVNKDSVRVEARGTTNVSELSIYANATIAADQGIVIPSIKVGSGAEYVELNANVLSLTIQNINPIIFNGSATIGNVELAGKASIVLNTTGTIQQLIAQNKEANLTINSGARVGNIILPEGTKANDIIKNFDLIKQNINQIAGQANPDARPTSPAPTPAPSTGGGSGDHDITPPVDRPVPPAVANVTVISSDTDTVKLGGVKNTITWSASSTSTVAFYEVYRTTNPNGMTDAVKVAGPVDKSLLTATDTTVTPGETYYYTVYAVDRSGKKSSTSNVYQIVTANDQIATLLELTKLRFAEVKNAIADLSSIEKIQSAYIKGSFASMMLMAVEKEGETAAEELNKLKEELDGYFPAVQVELKKLSELNQAKVLLSVVEFMLDDSNPDFDVLDNALLEEFQIQAYFALGGMIKKEVFEGETEEAKALKSRFSAVQLKGAKKLVDSLFVDPTKAVDDLKLKPEINGFVMMMIAQSVQSLPDSNEKTALQNKVQKAIELLMSTFVTLIADTSNNDTQHDIRIMEQPINRNWQENITSVYVDGIEINKDSWYVDGGFHIRAGVLSVGDNVIKVVATGFNDSTVTQTIIQNTPPTASPIITGTAKVGNELTVVSNYYDVDGDVEAGTTYEWYADDALIEGETSSTFTITEKEVGKNISVKVIPKNNYGTGTVTTSNIVWVDNESPTTTSLVFSGNGSLEETITINLSEILGTTEGTELPDHTDVKQAIQLTGTEAIIDTFTAVYRQDIDLETPGNQPGILITTDGDGQITKDVLVTINDKLIDLVGNKFTPNIAQTVTPQQN
ncbi:S-layer homology domain-containing protein [Bacillus sp. CGMCC 1.16607]|uniref:S-layer homology domain-containing protein n=1 Tax=Bacillus sp. CGMCC 1.16607 TaxID=3351842 RepID=UPI0036458438